jgi:hypothetical protein
MRLICICIYVYMIVIVIDESEDLTGYAAEVCT